LSPPELGSSEVTPSHLYALKGHEDARLLSFSKRDLYRQPTLTAGVALSYFHSEGSEGFELRNRAGAERFEWLDVLVIADELYKVAFRISDVEGTPMHPDVFGRLHTLPELLEPVFLGLIV
jgi:hypothetical protein